MLPNWLNNFDQLSEVEKHIIVQYYFWTGMKILKKTDSVHWEVKQASE